MMPAEWTPHRATWIAWPHESRDWPGRFGPIPWTFVDIVRVLSRDEQVAILVQDAAAEHRVSSMLRKTCIDLARVEFHRIPTDRSWMRDSGPTFVRDASDARLAIHWRFNGWAKYPNHKRDETVGARIARAAGVPEVRPTLEGRWIVMEGGAIDVDGEGTLLATEECLLSDVQARNPGVDRREIQRVFADTLGIRRVVWLGRGIVGDDTHGHIDDVARFVAPGRVVLCAESNPKDENYAILAENRERLQSARGLEVVPLPMPAPIVIDGMRVPASYANFLIANGRVLVPTFNDPEDRRALGLLAELFPDREVIGIHARDLIWGLGTLHCLTQQEPIGAPSAAEGSL
ncbi:MAG: agmatine deiminase family protein [Planctomycetes bacterium]|nr:agmatine deiminase family protein [Planctomycetota bacterium]